MWAGLEHEALVLGSLEASLEAAGHVLPPDVAGKRCVARPARSCKFDFFKGGNEVKQKENGFLEH